MEIKEKILKFYYNNKKTIFICLISLGVIIVFSTSLYLIFITNKDENSDNKENEISIALPKEESSQMITGSKTYVDIKGMIANPGVYEVDNTMIVNDVINLAGGLLENASTKYINLSKKVTNEMIIVIYSESQIDELKEEVIIPICETVECLCESTNNDACSISEGYLEFSQSFNSNFSDNLNDLININKATLEELISLPGIGEAKAKSIIEYRNTNGNFNTKESLMEVSGLGESIYTKIKDLITIE